MKAENLPTFQNNDELPLSMNARDGWIPSHLSVLCVSGHELS